MTYIGTYFKLLEILIVNYNNIKPYYFIYNLFTVMQNLISINNYIAI